MFLLMTLLGCPHKTPAVPVNQIICSETEILLDGECVCTYGYVDVPYSSLCEEISFSVHTSLNGWRIQNGLPAEVRLPICGSTADPRITLCVIDDARTPYTMPENSYIFGCGRFHGECVLLETIHH